MEHLKKADDGNGSEEDGIEDELSWCESDPELDAFSDPSSEIGTSGTKSAREDNSADKVLDKDPYLWKTTPKKAKITAQPNIVNGHCSPKGKGREANTPLKLYELFYGDAMVSEIVT